MGIFSVFSREKTPSSAELLKELGTITPQDIEKLLAIARNSPDKVEYDETMNRYLSIVNQVFNGTDYLTLGDTVGTRQQRYEIYDEMDESTSFISAALDILSDDSTQQDEDGVIIHVISDNAKVKRIVEDLFNDLEIEGQISKWARAIAKYGDFFLRVNQEAGKGVTGVIDTIYPSNIERRDLEGRLIAFCDTYGTMSSESIYPPWEFIHFRLKGDIYRRQQNANIAGLNKNTKVYSLTSSYGQSILRPAIKVYAQLRFVENLIILSRLTNSIRRNIFLINTGETDPAKAFETIRNYADLLKKDISLNIEQSVYNSQRHTTTYDEDIFIPVNDTKNDVRIESIGGDVNIAEQYDLEYLLNKLFSALKIPKAYLNYEQDLNARSTLIQLDIRYARSVSQIQTTLTGGLLRLAKIHLALKGIDPDTVDLDIALTSVSSIDKEARLEQKKISVETARTVWDMITTMNDKLSEVQGDVQAADSGITSILGENLFGDDPDVDDDTIDNIDTPNEVSKQNTFQSPLNLEYLTEYILGQYFEMGKDVIDKVMRRETKNSDSSSDPKDKDRIREHHVYMNADLREMYPIEENVMHYSSIKESILDSNLSQEDNSELKTFSDKEGMLNE